MAKVNKKRESAWILYNLFIQWLIETAAFILLPLFVYLLVFMSLGIEHTKLMELPEWMFIAIILFGESMRKTVIFYNKYEGFDLAVIREISFGLLGIVASSVFLVFSIIAHYDEEFVLSSLFYHLQLGIFLGAVIYSLLFSLWIGWKTGQGESLAYLIPRKREENKEQSDKA